MSLVLVLLVACDGNAPPSDCVVDGIDDGAVSATVDGAAWGSTITWLEAGSSLQLNAPTSDGWWFSMVLQSLADGTAAIEATTFPASFDLGGDGGWATLYPESGDSYTSRDGSGSLTLVEGGDRLSGCFDFTAVGSGGEVEVSEGRFVATAGSAR